mgnify:CR=1 FL=1
MFCLDFSSRPRSFVFADSDSFLVDRLSRNSPCWTGSPSGCSQRRTSLPHLRAHPPVPSLWALYPQSTRF